MTPLDYSTAETCLTVHPSEKEILYPTVPAAGAAVFCVPDRDHHGARIAGHAGHAPPHVCRELLCIDQLAPCWDTTGKRPGIQIFGR